MKEESASHFCFALWIFGAKFFMFSFGDPHHSVERFPAKEPTVQTD